MRCRFVITPTESSFEAQHGKCEKNLDILYNFTRSTNHPRYNKNYFEILGLSNHHYRCHHSLTRAELALLMIASSCTCPKDHHSRVEVVAIETIILIYPNIMATNLQHK
jgi:hypothetical protein